MSTILVDIDGTIAHWGGSYDAAVELHGEAAKNIRRHSQQQSFNLFEGISEEESEIVRLVMDTLDYENLEPIPGAIEALQQMLEDGHDVFLVTSPWVTNKACASGKVAWVIKHLGADWAKRLVISSDKTIVRGDYLFDDKPEITGAMAPTWSHIVFTQPYNKGVTNRRRIDDWTNWRDMVFPAMSSFGGPDAGGRCPIKGCHQYIEGIPEGLRGAPAEWYNGGSLESKIHEHNRTVHGS